MGIIFVKTIILSWMSRVTLPKELIVIIIEEDEKYINYTKNVVYKKMFNKLSQCNYFLFILFCKTIKKINSIYSFNI